MQETSESAQPINVSDQEPREEVLVTPSGAELEKMQTPHFEEAGIYTPISIEEAQVQYPGIHKLNFRPLMLQTWFLAGILLFYLAIIGGIYSLCIADSVIRQPHVLDSQNFHLIIRFIPAIIGTATTVLWRSVVLTLARISPYISMAQPSRHTTASRSLLASYFPAPLIAEAFRNKHHLLALCLLMSYFIGFITPLKSTLLIPTTDTNGTIYVAVTRGVGIALISLYTILSAMILSILIRLWGRPTGLRWDPVSIADQVALFHGSNVLQGFQGLDLADEEKVRSRLNDRRYSLGYWRKENGTLWYGIAEVAPDDLRENDDGFIGPEEKAGASRASGGPTKPFLEECERMRFLRIGEGLGPGLMLFFTILAFVIFILFTYALAAHSLTHGVHVRPGTVKLPGKRIEKVTFVDEFVRVLFTLVANQFFIRASIADQLYRVMQPYMNMLSPSPARENVLLEYPTTLPGLTTLIALEKGHYRVALASLVALISPAYPVLTAGLFTKPIGQNIFIATSLPTMWAVYAFTILYCASLPALWPPKSAWLPRRVVCIADVLTFCYANTLLNPEAPELDLSAPDEDREYMRARLLLKKDQYAFGVFKGFDGEWHLGFDVAQSMGRDTEMRVLDYPQVSTFRRRLHTEAHAEV
ncbi:hypothetical protein BOTBODRAFT_172974 [Botryobasidium botryosum FD-172 SS1]|uniref:Uncharacterized protein n=1 Tax=Botryobasidium botryosum (strain FD-172 SS1) TaxID=930990 RepID=A0A067MLN5_BOTB1|nr:hypothetical protein BOTBODRAFT_172974 [Botryobasidium botryosum FD-172 SS1]